jgi:hypothetical protein
VNYVTKVAAKTTGKKISEIGILINASSLSWSASIIPLCWNKRMREMFFAPIGLRKSYILSNNACSFWEIIKLTTADGYE